jgi:predicted dehydrogenase
LLLDKVADDVEVLFTASAGLTEHAVMTWRPATNMGLFTVDGAAMEQPAYRRLVHRWLRRALAVSDGPAARVGLLGYGAIGHEHNAAICAVDGLELAAVCDRDPDRIAAARTLAPEVRGYDDAAKLVEADDVDVVIVSTPPNTHADWALRALSAGKHVVVEKPFCLTTAEADEMLAAAADAGRVLAVYQNRRWDSDYLTLKKLVRSGAVGEVFHYESFIGTFGHPCNFWHSDEEVSGGAIYDWGSHYLDWVLDLLPQQVEHVTAATQKRRWHDVTNADHSRVTVRFVDGVEAEFIHSDIAAAMKPKWYVLGTEGAIVGSWRSEKVVARDAVGNLREDVLAPSEAPASLTLHAADGSVTSVVPVTPPRQPFHRELADLLVSGVPMSVTPQGSRRNIAVMEAATVSARESGRPVVPG